MTIQEELNRLRLEMRKNRQEKAITERSLKQARTKNEELKQTVDRLHEQIRIIEVENEALKNRLASILAYKDKIMNMLFKKHAPAPVAALSKKQRGGQIGHVGHGKPTPLDVDEEKNIHLTHCPDCQKPLHETDGTYTRTVTDIPLPKATTTRYMIQRQWCEDRKSTRLNSSH